MAGVEFDELPERVTRECAGHLGQAQHFGHHQEHDEAAVGIQAGEPHRN